MTDSHSAVVLGAGIQGICAALALRSRGYDVTLIDQESASMLRTSSRNEAKIHLGFVYANDATFRTSSLMLDASLAFGSNLDRWLESPLPWETLRSTPFTYAVMNDSLLTTDELEGFYDRVQAAYAERRDEGSYLGLTPKQLWRPIADDAWPSWINRSEITGLMGTEEVALDLPRFRKEVIGRLSELGGIETRYGHRVDSAARTSSGFRADGFRQDGTPWTEEADILVNCLWTERLALDDSLGLQPKRSWVYRLKYRLLGQLPAKFAALPSMTFVLGPYGDIATYEGSATYLNWYPACMKAWSSELAPPSEWADACRGLVGKEEAASITQESLAALDRLIPGIAEARIDQVDAGVIVSWGQSHVDVDDPDSELHERHEIGVHAHDGYFSIDTGKFTCAPYFASRLLDHLQ